MRKHLPNLLSFSRLTLALVFPFATSAQRIPLIGWAILSEFLDGYLARRWNAHSELGQLLDPVADKAFVLSSLGTLVALGRLSGPDLVLISLRDIIVAIGSLAMTLTEPRANLESLKPRSIGKIATTLQFTLIAWLYVLTERPAVLFTITVMASAIAGADYLYAVLHRRFDPIEPRRS